MYWTVYRKETLIGANIYDQKNGVGTTTNPFGYFSITLPEGALN